MQLVYPCLHRLSNWACSWAMKNSSLEKDVLFKSKLFLVVNDTREKRTLIWAPLYLHFWRKCTWIFLKTISLGSITEHFIFTKFRLRYVYDILIFWRAIIEELHDFYIFNRNSEKLSKRCYYQVITILAFWNLS